MPVSIKDNAISFLKLAASGKVEEAYSKFIASGFQHHNPYFEGSADALKAGMEEDFSQNPDKELEVKLAIAEEEFVVVFTHIKQKPADPGWAVAHIFRFEDGKIVEMWDLGQQVSEVSPNQYGMF